MQYLGILSQRALSRLPTSFAESEAQSVVPEANLNDQSVPYMGTYVNADFTQEKTLRKVFSMHALGSRPGDRRFAVHGEHPFSAAQDPLYLRKEFPGIELFGRAEGVGRCP